MTMPGATPAQLELLATRRVFFGHQSVGDNIVSGVRDLLREDSSLSFHLVETAAPEEMDGAGFYHARIGVNGRPETKLAEWARIVAAAARGADLIALLKFCYVDVSSETDVDRLFDSYRRTVTELEAGAPGLAIVHVTMPLMSDPGWLRHHAARMRRLTSLRDVNARRARYSALLRAEYAGRSPLFDIEALESMDTRGRRRVRRSDRDVVPFLNPAWTDDGGHLNEAGRVRMAREFLATLASAC